MPVRLFAVSASLLGALALPAGAAVLLTAEATYPAVMEVQGRVTGHAAEKIHEIMRRTGIEYTMALMPWKRAYTLAATQAATCVFMTTRTEEREAMFKWIGPISQADWVLYGRADRSYQIRTLDDARGLTIGSYNGDVRGESLAARGLNVEFVQNDESNPKKLMLDRIDLWVNSTRSSRPLLARLGLTGKIAPVLTFHQAKLYLACHTSMPDADVGRMNRALRDMEADGSYKAIEQRFEYLQKP
jgi:polar amino acid transport system substrate-binding protein